MSFVTLNTAKLRENYETLDRMFAENNIEWSIVAKVFCGNEKYLNEVIKLGNREICDSRLSNLKAIKAIDPGIQTVYIKPPVKRMAETVVKYADVSFNTELDTMAALSDEAVKQNKVHKVVIMIEMGELREGVLRDEFLGLYEKAVELPNINVVGIGTNMACMYGVLPSQDKLIQLDLFKQLVSYKYNKNIPYITGGSSVTIPLISQGTLPKAINHFRIGETLYFGTDVYNNKPFENMHNDVFKLYGEIIEINEKPKIPEGSIGFNLKGEKPEFDAEGNGGFSYRAIVDIGLLDVETTHLKPLKESMSISGASSDMLVIDLGSNEEGLMVGGLIAFTMDYMGLLRVMNSNYVMKLLENELKPAELEEAIKAWE